MEAPCSAKRSPGSCAISATTTSITSLTSSGSSRPNGPSRAGTMTRSSTQRSRSASDATVSVCFRGSRATSSSVQAAWFPSHGRVTDVDSSVSTTAGSGTAECCCAKTNGRRPAPTRDFAPLRCSHWSTVLELDVVAGRARQGQHSVEHVVSYAVRGGELGRGQPAHRQRQPRRPPDLTEVKRPVSAAAPESRCSQSAAQPPIDRVVQVASG